MNFVGTTKNIILTESDIRVLKKSLQKIERHISHVGKSIRIEMVLERHHHHIKDRNFSTPTYYAGKLVLSLPHKQLVSKLTGDTLPGTIRDGVDKIILKLDKYKGKNYTSDSDYPDHSSIRKQTQYVKSHNTVE